MTDLDDLAPRLRNVMARPGTFTSLFPETVTADLVAVLADGLAECHLEGLLPANEVDDNDAVVPDLASGEQALLLLFSGIRLIRAELLNRATTRKYSGGPASFEEQQSSQLLRDVISSMQAQKDRIVGQQSATQSAGSIFAMADAYIIRSTERGGLFGYYDELSAYGFA